MLKYDKSWFQHVSTNFNTYQHISTNFNKFQQISTNFNKFQHDSISTTTSTTTWFDSRAWHMRITVLLCWWSGVRFLSSSSSSSTAFNTFQHVSINFNTYQHISTNFNKFQHDSKARDSLRLWALIGGPSILRNGTKQKRRLQKCLRFY